MPKSYAEELGQKIQELGTHSLKPDWDAESGRQREKVFAGPNRWLEVKDDPKAYGGNGFDYRILDGDVFAPDCLAAQEWIRSKVGEDQHWYEVGDFWGVQVTRLDQIVASARRDGLIREADYVSDMNSENDNLMRSGE